MMCKVESTFGQVQVRAIARVYRTVGQRSVNNIILRILNKY